MADLATIVNLPRSNGEFATVRDRFGNHVNVKPDELPDDPEEGQQFAYRVIFSNNGAGNWTVKPKD